MRSQEVRFVCSFNSCPDRLFFKSSISYMFAPGSIRGGVFNLCSATLGAGALSLPHAFQMSGWVSGIILLILGEFMTILTIDLLIKAREASGYKSYEDMTVCTFTLILNAIVVPLWKIPIIVGQFGHPLIQFGNSNRVCPQQSMTILAIVISLPFVISSPTLSPLTSSPPG